MGNCVCYALFCNGCCLARRPPGWGRCTLFFIVFTLLTLCKFVSITIISILPFQGFAIAFHSFLSTQNVTSWNTHFPRHVRTMSSTSRISLIPTRCSPDLHLWCWTKGNHVIFIIRYDNRSEKCKVIYLWHKSQIWIATLYGGGRKVWIVDQIGLGRFEHQ